MRSHHLFSLRLYSVLAASLLAAPALADTAPETVRAVQFADLDLESSAGRATLERRIGRAVQALCAVDSAPFSAALAEERTACEAETSRDAAAHLTTAIRINRARTASYASR